VYAATKVSVPLLVLLESEVVVVVPGLEPAEVKVAGWPQKLPVT
jgi:hypothetical protein